MVGHLVVCRSALSVYDGSGCDLFQCMKIRCRLGQCGCPYFMQQQEESYVPVSGVQRRLGSEVEIFSFLKDSSEVPWRDLTGAYRDEGFCGDTAQDSLPEGKEGMEHRAQ